MLTDDNRLYIRLKNERIIVYDIENNVELNMLIE